MKKELNLETKPLNYNFDKDSIGGTVLREGDTIISLLLYQNQQ